MSTQKNNFNWSKLVEKGKIEDQLKVHFKKLADKFINRFLTENKIDPSECKKFTLNDEIILQIENKLESIFSNYEIFTEKERRKYKHRFFQNLEKRLDLLITKVPQHFAKHFLWFT